MTNITLFDAAQAVREAINQIDPDTGELVESYTETSCARTGSSMRVASTSMRI